VGPTGLEPMTFWV